MKFLFILFAGIFLPVILWGQNKLFLTGGANYGYFMKEEAGTVTNLRKTNPGFQLGISYQHNNPNNYSFTMATAQLLFVPVKYAIGYEDAATKSSRPVYLQLSPAMGLRANLSEQAALHGTLGGYLNVLTNFQNAYRYLNVGLSGSIGLDITKRIQVGADYLFGLTNLLSDKYRSDELYLRNIQLNIRYKVFERAIKKKGL